MKYLSASLLLTGSLILCAPSPALAQIEPPASEVEFVPKSGGKAVLLSLAVPGLGHRYVHGGSWRGAASFFGLADASLWLGLVGANWREDQVIDSYRALAVSAAGADLDGKTRRFFLNLGAFESSDAFREAMLRQRAWDQLSQVDDPAFQWEWASDAALQEYRALRDEADSWSRRRTLFISALVANRLIAGITALRAARRHNRAAPDLSLSFTAPPPGTDVPVVRLSLRLR